MMIFKCDRCKKIQPTYATPHIIEASKGLLKERLFSVEICKDCYDELLPLIIPSRDIEDEARWELAKIMELVSDKDNIGVVGE